ncbi:MAG: class I SAM-dependent methyltransferase [Euryarchaeota archaeon]|nr:class I SAM-dependent methyltransferase [Euryarchaeota archaeon]
MGLRPIEPRPSTNDGSDPHGGGFSPQLLQLLKPYGDHLLDMLKVRKGEAVLDVACGFGEPAITAARIVGPAGRVVGIDIAARELDIARAAAKGQGVRNVDFRTMDAETLEFPDSTFDVVVSRFGLQSFHDPALAVSEMHRVVKPGGRVGLVVWSLAERVPAIDCLLRPLMKHVPSTRASPNQYGFGAPGSLATLLRSPGFTDIREERFTSELAFNNPDEYERVMRYATPFARRWADFDKVAMKIVREEMSAHLRRYVRSARIFVPAEAVLTVATRPWT